MQLKTNLKVQPNSEENFSSLNVVYEQEHELAWYKMNAYPRACFTSELVNEIGLWFSKIISGDYEYSSQLKYIVMSSENKDSFCLGGDLALFLELIRAGREEDLVSYDKACVDAMLLNYKGLNKGITTISLIQGDALGGGFEAAISSDIVIAESSAKLGLPDILFNLFPGAGAYSFLSRKVGMVEAERMILSGKLYTAKEMYDLGVIDVLVGDGEGEQAVYNYIKKENRARNGYTGFRKVKKLCNPVTQRELHEGARIWGEAAMNLQGKDLRMMERLVKRQFAKASS